LVRHCLWVAWVHATWETIRTQYAPFGVLSAEQTCKALHFGVLTLVSRSYKHLSYQVTLSASVF
jgi:hypothetical protein